MNNKSSASTSTALFCSDCPSINLSHQKSLPEYILTSSPVRLSTTTFSTESDFEIASSTTSFTGICFFPLKFPSEVNIILAWQSFIRSAKAFAENPAKTTE